MTILAQAIAQLDATLARVAPIDPIEAMRQWRIEASKNHVRREPLMRAAKKPTK